MLTFATLTLLVVSVRPHCGAENVGQIWPEAANHDSSVMMNLARDGNLRICSTGLWKYQWESPTVSLRQMEDPTSENWRAKHHGLVLTKR